VTGRQERPLLRREGTTPAGEPWLVRPTRADEDAAELLAIRDEVAAEGELIAAVPGELSLLEENLALANLIAGGGLGLVAEVGGRIAGNLMVHRRRGRYEGHVGELSIALRRDYRGVGVGRALMETAIDWARAVGVAKLTLGVFPDNAPALGLYRAVGFVEEGVLRAQVRLPAGDRDLTVMGMLIRSS
jgi:GNAT superfamily N-acetyltransferase